MGHCWLVVASVTTPPLGRPGRFESGVPHRYFSIQTHKGTSAKYMLEEREEMSSPSYGTSGMWGARSKINRTRLVKMRCDLASQTLLPWFEKHYLGHVKLELLIAPPPEIPAKIQARLGSLPKYEGIYVFWGHGRPLYVGEASRLRDRIRSHLGGYSSNHYLQLWFRLDRFENCEIQAQSLRSGASKLERLTVESAMVAELAPLFNLSPY